MNILDAIVFCVLVVVGSAWLGGMIADEIKRRQK